MPPKTRKQAIAEGSKRYYTGVPCKYGHLSDRRTSTKGCLECEAERWRSDEVKAQRRKFRAEKMSDERKAREKETRKRWRAQNLDRAREYCRKYYERNAKRLREQRKAYRIENPDKYAVSGAKYRASKLDRTPAWADLEHIAWFYEIAREETARTGIAHHVDHIVPLQGTNVCGLHVETNLQILLWHENLGKGNQFEPQTELDTKPKEHSAKNPTNAD